MTTINECKYCNRSGLPILPLRLAYVPGGMDGMGLDRSTKLVFPMEQGKYMSRIITSGYVYTLDMRAGGFWRCFAATTSGHFREYPVDERPSTQPTFQCARDGHSDVASIITVENAKDAGEVWIGYSHVWWSKAVRKTLKGDAKKRGALMTQIDAKKLVTGGAVDPTAGYRCTDSAMLDKHVAEYGAFPIVSKIYASNTTHPAVERSGQAGALIERMHAISPGNAIVLPLGDAVGNLEDTNHWRNLKAGELAKFLAAETRSEKYIIGGIVKGLEKSLEDKGQGKEWKDRYAQHLDMHALDRDLATHNNTVKRNETKILAASNDWLGWVKSVFFTAAWKVYDGDDKQYGKALGHDLETDFAHAVFGSGATKKEQAWWDHILSQAPSDPDNPLWLAFAAGDKDVVTYLKGDSSKTGDVGKTDKGTDILKNTKEGMEEFEEWLHKRHAGHLVRTVSEEAGMIGNTISSQLSRLATAAPAQALVIGTRVRVVVASRLDAIIRPHSWQGTTTELIEIMHETVWGPPTATVSKTIREAQRLKIVQSMDGAYLGGHFTSAKVVTIESWLPDEAARLPAAAVRAALPGPGAVLALPRPALNPWESMLDFMKGKTGGIVLLGGVLQIVNLSGAIVQLNTALKGNAKDRDDSIHEAIFGITSGVLGVMGVTAEVSANVIKGRIVASIARTAEIKLLTASAWLGLAGGLLASGSAAAEGVQAFVKFWGLARDGDLDAAASYGVAGSLFVVSAISGAAVSIIGAASALSAAGATGAVATTIMTTAITLVGWIPVWGWIAIGIAAVIAGIYLLYQGATKEDTPLEKWLSRCCYRDQTSYFWEKSIPKFANLKEELMEFQQAIYGLTISLKWNDSLLGKDEIEFEVIMPGYTPKASEYAYLLQLDGPKWHTEVSRHASAFSTDKDLQPREEKLYFSAIKPGTKSIPTDQVLEFPEPMQFHLENGVGTVRGKVLANETYYNHARLKFEYWPNAAQNPELKMTPGPSGNYLDAAD
jgi:hypothetical protein